ncbi:WD repeat-containing protein [Lachnellula occidentalis]|uniref:WD repeat-containing protein n=1 Tax=Lachnellula occidentalis TaxID=215460 RepID=A0A8H8SA22_9HELO|nr:WD repeat-containing protein [Lachnellula occidentalis]
MWNMKTGECIKDLLTDLTGVWQVKFDERRCVAAVQRDNLTYVEVLDFGASRDGIPASDRGSRKLVSFDDHRSSGIVEEDEDL